MTIKRYGGGMIWEVSASPTTTGTAWTGPWTVIPQVMGTITLPGGTATKIDITTHDDIITYGKIRQNAGGIADVTDPGGSILWDPDDTVHQKLLAAFQAGSVFQFRFTFASSTGVVTKKYGAMGQVSIGNGTSDINGYVTYPVTVVANTVNFNVA